jgi:hypothetical protein
MRFTTREVTFRANAQYIPDLGRLKVERSELELTLIPSSDYSAHDPIKVVSVREPTTFEELDTEHWSLERISTNDANKGVRHRLLFDGARYTKELCSAKCAERDTLHQAFVFGGRIELTVADSGGHATHIYLNLDFASHGSRRRTTG